MNRRQFVLAGAALPLGLALEPRALASPVGGGPLAFVTADLESHVVVFDPAQARVVGRIATLPAPRSIENVDGANALVAHTSLGRLSIVNGPDRRVRAVVHGPEARATPLRVTVSVLDDRLGVQAVRRIARAAHDACLLTAF